MRKKISIPLLVLSTFLSGCTGCTGCVDDQQAMSVVDETSSIDTAISDDDEQTPDDETVASEIQADTTKSSGQKRIDIMRESSGNDVYSEFYSKYKDSDVYQINVADGGLTVYPCTYTSNTQACAVTGIESIEGAYENFDVPDGESNRYYMPVISGYVETDVVAGNMYKVDIKVKNEDGKTCVLEDQLLTVSSDPVPDDAWPLFTEPYVRYVGDPDRLPTRYFGENYPIILQRLNEVYIGQRTSDDSTYVEEHRLSYLESEIKGSIIANGAEGSEYENSQLDLVCSGLENVNFDVEGIYTVNVSATDPSNGLTSTIQQKIRVSHKVDAHGDIKEDYGKGSANDYDSRLAMS